MTDAVTAAAVLAGVPAARSDLIGLERFASGQTFPDFVMGMKANADLMRAVHSHAHVRDEAVARVAALTGHRHLLVLTEDWCGDAVNTLPVVARLTERVPTVDLHILGRDANPDLMNAHLTNGTRSIPVIMVLDEEYRERGWWGPRPRVLQAWFLSEGRFMPKVDRYRELRRWYARDHGATTIDELVALLEASDQT